MIYFSVTKYPLNAYRFQTIILSFFPCIVVPSFIIRKVSARKLFSVSHFITTIAYLGFATFVFLHKMYPNLMNLNYFGWIPLVTIIIPLIMRNIGIVPLLDMLGMILDHVK